MEREKNIILIGMPASGKSTVGVILAKVLGKDFIDTDLVIQQRENALLCEIQRTRGIPAFLKCEEEAVLSVSRKNAIIATGGSVVYSEAAMRYLAETGIIVYLKVEKNEIFRRLHDINERGVVLKDGESLEEMFESRSILYEKYADVVIEEKNSSIEETVKRIEEELANEGKA